MRHWCVNDESLTAVQMMLVVPTPLYTLTRALRAQMACDHVGWRLSTGVAASAYPKRTSPPQWQRPGLPHLFHLSTQLRQFGQHFQYCFYDVCTTEHTCAAKLPHINGNMGIE